MDYQPRCCYALYSSLVAFKDDISLKQTKIVMMKRFTRKMFQ